MFKKVISILQNELRSRTEVVSDTTGIISENTKAGQAEIVVEILLAVDALQSMELDTTAPNSDRDAICAFTGQCQYQNNGTAKTCKLSEYIHGCSHRQHP